MELFLPDPDAVKALNQQTSGASRSERAEYSLVFSLVAEMLDTVPNSDEQALRISTCRNSFLLVNSLFVDLQKIFGYSDGTPPPVPVAFEYLKIGPEKKANDSLERLGYFVASARQKLDTWKSREALDLSREEYISAQKGPIAEKLRLTFEAVRTSEAGYEPPIDPAYFAISNEEVASCSVHLDYLRRVFQELYEIQKLGRAILAYSQKDGLFTQDGDEAWQTVRVCLNMWNARFLEATPVEPPELRPDNQIVTELLSSTIERVIQRIHTLRHEASQRFIPNVGKAPMPAPFKIDLSDAKESHPKDLQVAKFKVVNLSNLRPNSLRLGLPGLGIPVSYYHYDSKRLLDSARRVVWERVREMLNIACAHNVNLLVLPEYSFPRDHIEDLNEFARETGVTVIAGVEGETRQNVTLNQIFAFWPGKAELQASTKQRPSVYENELYQGEGLGILRSTIGTVALLVCSDYREVDIMERVAHLGEPVDLLIVCAMNPNPGQFQVLAQADAHRLYCHVIVANNRLNKDGTASDEGSFVCSPLSDATKMCRTEPDESIGVGTSASELGTSALKIFDISLKDLHRGDAIPAPGYLPCPSCRKVSN